MRLQIGNKEFEVTVSETPEQSRIGLSNTESLVKGEGFAMKFEGTHSIPITMKDMKYPLDIIFSLKGKVTRVISAQPGVQNIKIQKPSDLIIEVNHGAASDIFPGDEIKFLGKKNEDGTVEMAHGGINTVGDRHVLDENGQNQMNLKGGERIYSRIATRKIFELAKAKDYTGLGKFLIKETLAQDSRPVEYSKN